MVHNKAQEAHDTPPVVTQVTTVDAAVHPHRRRPLVSVCHTRVRHDNHRTSAHPGIPSQKPPTAFSGAGAIPNGGRQARQERRLCDPLETVWNVFVNSYTKGTRHKPQDTRDSNALPLFSRFTVSPQADTADAWGWAGLGWASFLSLLFSVLAFNRDGYCASV